MEIVKQNENKLLGRKEVVAKIMSDGPTIARAAVKSELAKKFKAEEKHIIIDKVEPVYGSKMVLVEANIYDKEDAMSKITAGHILKRNAMPQEASDGATEGGE